MSAVRRARRRRSWCAAWAVSALGAWSCGGGGEGFVNPPQQVVVVMSPATASVNVGGTSTFSVSITGGSPVPTLSTCASSNPGIATASVSGSSCVGTGVSGGTATITATTSGSQVSSSLLTVVALPAAMTAFTLTPPTATLSVGQTVLLTAVPVLATGASVTITYATANPAVATVSAGGVVTAIAAGSTVVSATALASGSNLSPTSLVQTSTITVGSNACAPIVLSLPVARNGSVTASSCVLTTDIQRRGDVLRVNLASPAAIELRLVPVGFTAYLTAYPAAESEFIFFNGNPSQELRRTWHLPSGLTELKIGAAAAGQTGSYSFSAASVSASVTGCVSVVTAGSLQSTQSLSATDCSNSGRLADEFLLYSARSCVITMNRDVASSMTNPFLEVYAGTQVYAIDNDSGGNSNARISLAACRSPANEVLSVRATSFGAGDTGNYIFTVTFGP